MALCTDREHPLHFAALGGHADAIACLLDAGVASIEVKDAFGNTPLLYAAMAASSTRAWVGVWMQKVCRCVRLHPQQVVRSCARCLPFRYTPPLTCSHQFRESMRWWSAGRNSPPTSTVWA